MRIIRHVVVAALILLVPGVSAVAQQDADSLYQQIKDLGDKKLDARGKSAEVFRAEVTKFFDDLIGRCESFRTRFPESGQLGEVVYEEAKAYFWRSRYTATKQEDLEKGAALARKAIEMNPKVDAAAKSRGLLIQYYKMYGKTNEMLQQAEAIVADFPGTTDAALALRYIAETYEGMKKDAEADKAWEKLATEYPESSHGKRAAGILAARKFKGNALDLTFTSSTGQAIDVKTYRGKVVLVYLWSPGDASSRTNLALIAQTEKLLRDRGFVVLGACLEKDKTVMDAAVKNAGADWPQHFDGKKWDNEVAAKLGIRAIPSTVLVDRTGKVREIGLLGQPLVTAVRGLLDEAAK